MIWRLSIVLILLNQLSQATEINSCSATASAGEDTSLAVTIAYNDTLHNKTKIRLDAPTLTPYNTMEGSCDNVSASNLQNISQCGVSTTAAHSQIFFRYEQENVTSTTIYFYTFNFPADGIEFDNTVLRVRAGVNQDYGNWTYCSAFSVPEDAPPVTPPDPLRGKFIYIYIYIRYPVTYGKFSDLYLWTNRYSDYIRHRN